LEALRDQALLTQQHEFIAQFRIVRADDGKVRWIEARNLIFYDQSGKPSHLIGVSIDLTERKSAEHALAERNLQLRLAAKAGLVGTFTYDTHTEIGQISPGYAAIHGLPEGTAEITRSEWLARLHPEDVERVQLFRNEAFRERREEYSVDYRIVRRDGEIRWIESRVFILYGSDANAHRVNGVNIDVTERKRAEVLIKESKTRLADALTAGQVIAFEWDALTRVSQRSDNTADILGSNHDGLAGSLRKDFLRHVHPDDRTSLKTRIHQLRPRNPSYALTFRFIRPDGRLVWLEETAKGEFDATGKFLRIKGLTRDITDRKRAEDALAERNAQIALAGRAALVGTYTYDVNKGAMQISEGYAAIHGLPEGTTETSYSEWRARVHPEDLGRAEGSRNQAFADRWKEDNAEYRIVLPTGEVRWIERRGSILYSEDGRPERVVGVNIDVTERRRTEQALTDRDRQLKLAGKAALVGSFVIDIDAAREDFSSQRIQFSPGFAAIYGLPEETTEISVGDWRRLVHPDDLPQFVEHRQQLFAERRGEHHAEHRIVHPSGTIRWIETRSFIEYDQAGHAKRLVGVNIDITERKRAEEARKILNAELDHRVKNALATVSAVISHSQRGRRSVADFAAAVEGRIHSMAATHELLSSRQWQGLSLADLVRRELAPYVTRNNTEINGPEVGLRAEAGQAMAMVLHELATNAAKYGAFSTEEGRVSIWWGRQMNGHPPRLVLEWQEIGGPLVVAPDKSSFGTSTIRELIPYEFGGTVDLVFAPEGVRCRLELPADWLSNAGEPLPEARHERSAVTGDT
jgi:PAS domain S-box-containing protein